MNIDKRFYLLLKTGNRIKKLHLIKPAQQQALISSLLLNNRSHLKTKKILKIASFLINKTSPLFNPKR